MDKKAEERLLQAYKDLINYIHWLSGRSGLYGHWAMNSDDIEAELLLTLTNISIKYVNKPYEEFIILAKTSLHNRVKRLMYTHTLTFRKNELYAESLEDEPEDYEERHNILDVTCVMSENLSELSRNPQDVFDETVRLETIVHNLSEFDQQVLRTIMGGNERMDMYLDIHRVRKDFVFRQPTITISPHLVARSLCESIEDVEAAYKRIGAAFATTYIQ